MKRPWLRIKLCDFIPPQFTSSDVACYHPKTRTIWVIRRLPRAQLLWTPVHELGHWLIDLAGAGEGPHNRYDRFWMRFDPYPVSREALGLPNSKADTLTAPRVGNV